MCKCSLYSTSSPSCTIRQSEAVFGIVNVDSEYICLAMEEKRDKQGYGRLKYCAVSFSFTTIIDTLYIPRQERRIPLIPKECAKKNN